jgi:hypothetical protein
MCFWPCLLVRGNGFQNPLRCKLGAGDHNT